MVIDWGCLLIICIYLSNFGCFDRFIINMNCSTRVDNGFVFASHFESQSAIMSDFPKGGDISSTRAWLDNEGFIGFFDGWKADAILGLDKTDIQTSVPGENGLKLWGFLNTARQTTG